MIAALFTLFLFSSIAASSQFCCVVAPPVGKDSVTYQFDTLTANQETLSYVKHMVGYMHKLPATTAVGGNSGTLRVTAVPANWPPTGGNTQFPNDGITNGNAFPWLTKVQREAAFMASSSVFLAANPQLTLSGYKPLTAYTAYITYSINPSILTINCNTDYRIIGGSSGTTVYGPVTLNGQPGGVANVSGSVSLVFTTDATGSAKIYVNIGTSGQLPGLSCLRILEN